MAEQGETKGAVDESQGWLVVDERQSNDEGWLVVDERVPW
jgi:hypothetical protein